AHCSLAHCRASLSVAISRRACPMQCCASRLRRCCCSLRASWHCSDLGHLYGVLMREICRCKAGSGGTSKISRKSKGEHRMSKSALVCGAGGFIGGHLVKQLKRDGYWVRAVDLKFHEYSETEADDFVIGDLRDRAFCRTIVDRRFDEVYQLA